MRRRIIVHAGLPKCGSSRLQALLHHHRPEALAHGVYVAAEGGADDAARTNMLSLTAELVRWRGPGPSPVLAALLAAFDASGAPAMILSSESFAVRGPRIRRDAVGDLLRGFDVDLVLFYRRHDRWLLSYYKQCVRMAERCYPGTFADFLRAPPPYAAGGAHFSLTVVASALAERLGTDRVRLVDLDRSGGDVVAPFSALSGLPMQAWEVPDGEDRGINASLDDARTLFLAELNRRGAAPDARRSIVAALARAPLPPRLATASLLSQRRSARLLRLFHCLNAPLASRFGLDLPDHGPADPAGPVRERIDPEEFAVVAATMIPTLPVAARRALTG